MSLNRWEGIGNLGSDPELSYLSSGTAVVNISLACNEKYKDKAGEMREVVEWVRCVVFDKRAETLAQYCRKGSKLFVEGKLRTRRWQDKEGNDKHTTEIVVSGFQFLDSKPGDGSARTQAQGSYPEANRGAREYAEASGGGGNGSTPEDDEDVPF